MVIRDPSTHETSAHETSPDGRKMRPSLIALRGALVVFLGVIGAVHLHLWLGTYQLIPKISQLFLANVVIAWLAALAWLTPLDRLTPARLAAAGRDLLALASALFAAGTLAGYATSLMTPLFGFMEPGMSYSGMISIAAEGATILCATLWLSASRSIRASRPHLVA